MCNMIEWDMGAKVIANLGNVIARFLPSLPGELTAPYSEIRLETVSNTEISILLNLEDSPRSYNKKFKLSLMHVQSP